MGNHQRSKGRLYTIYISVCQKYSALSNLLLNIHGHAEVPKGKKNYMLRFRRIREFQSYLKGTKKNQF